MWPFKRKPKAPPHFGPKTVDWMPGDWAECVSDLIEQDGGPKKGERNIVAEVFYGTARNKSFETFALRFVSGETGYGWTSVLFQKITLTETGADRKVGKRKPVTVQS